MRCVVLAFCLAASACSMAFWDRVELGAARAGLTIDLDPYPELHIYGGPDESIFLGCINCSDFVESSVQNEGGPHASKRGVPSILNHAGEYGSVWVSDI